MRLQLALNVNDLDQAIDFYSKMFATPPAKIRHGYANFAIESPPLKLVLFEGSGPDGSINHLGVEVKTPGEVKVVDDRFNVDGLDPTGVEDTLCCYAEKTETWVTAPDGNRWEWYVKSGDGDVLENVVIGSGGEIQSSAASNATCCPC